MCIRDRDYVGAIMDLCQDRRGEYKEMTYLDADRVDFFMLIEPEQLSVFW